MISVISPLLFVIPPAQATTLGGLDLDKACKEMQTGRNQQTQVVMYDQKDAYSWKCQISTIGIVQEKGFDLDAICKKQYYSKTAYAKAGNLKDAYSWKCYEPGMELPY